VEAITVHWVNSAQPADTAFAQVTCALRNALLGGVNLDRPQLPRHSGPGPSRRPLFGGWRVPPLVAWASSST
jgi:hypothetical protein